MQKTKIKGMYIILQVLLLFLLCAASVSAADNVKKLYFEEQNGKMVWNAEKGDSGNWFMNFENMVPGGEYRDGLKIENGSKKTYKLYMQAEVVEQTKLQDELLEKIYMTVSLDGKKLYEGTASGQEYENGNLQKVVYLGTYAPKEFSKLDVNLKLDAGVGLEYCEVFGKTDWRFMVVEVVPSESSDSKVNDIESPQTGDDASMLQYILIMGVAILAVIVMEALKKRKWRGDEMD